MPCITGIVSSFLIDKQVPLPSIVDMQLCNDKGDNYSLVRVFNSTSGFGTTMGACLDQNCHIEDIHSFSDLIDDFCLDPHRPSTPEIDALCAYIQDELLPNDEINKPVSPRHYSLPISEQDQHIIRMNITFTQTNKIIQNKVEDKYIFNSKKIKAILKCGNGINMQDKELFVRMAHSGQALDLGSYDECNALPNAHHCLSKFRASVISLYQGQCVPKSCNESDMKLAMEFLNESKTPLDCLHLYPLASPRFCLSTVMLFNMLGPNSPFNREYRRSFTSTSTIDDAKQLLDSQRLPDARSLQNSISKNLDALKNTDILNIDSASSSSTANYETVMRRLRETSSFNSVPSIVHQMASLDPSFSVGLSLFLSERYSLLSHFLPSDEDSTTNDGDGLHALSPALKNAFLQTKALEAANGLSHPFLNGGFSGNERSMDSSIIDVNVTINDDSYHDRTYWSTSCDPIQASTGAGDVITSMVLGFCVIMSLAAAGFQTYKSTKHRSQNFSHHDNNDDKNNKKIAAASSADKTEKSETSNNAKKEIKDKPAHHHEKTVFERVMHAFNPRSNWNSLFHVKKRKHINHQHSEIKRAVLNNEEVLPFSQEIDNVHGLRALSMFWVIFGHSFCFMWSTLPLKNAMAPYDDYKSWWFPLAPGGFFAVDTFFAISGFLFSYLLIIKSAKVEKDHQKKIDVALTAAAHREGVNVILDGMRPSMESNNPLLDSEERKREILKEAGVRQLPQHQVFIGEGILFRYLRLTPIYALTMAIYVFLTPHLFDGPLWNSYISFTRAGNCATVWWRNLLYIDTWFPSNEDCLGWGWYMANDMQLFICSLFLMSAYLYRAKNPQHRTWLRMGTVILTITLMCASISRLAYFADIYDITINTIGMMTNMGMYYYKLWARAPAYLIGMLFGVLISENRDTITRFLIKQEIFRRCVHALTLSLLVLLIWMPYWANQLEGIPMISPTKPNPFPHWFDVLYTSLSRPIWAVCISWLVITSCCGAGMRFVNGFLSAKFFVPISRLSFSCYMLHPLVIFTTLNSSHAHMYYQTQLPFWFFQLFIIGTFLLATPIHIMFELPISNLMNMFLLKPSRGHKSNKKDKIEEAKKIDVPISAEANVEGALVMDAAAHPGVMSDAELLKAVQLEGLQKRINDKSELDKPLLQ